MRIRSLQRRLALIILGIGMIAILPDSGLIGTLLARNLVYSNGAGLAARATALSSCWAWATPEGTRAPTLRAAMAAAVGSAPRQFALVVDSSGHPIGGSALPPRLARVLRVAVQTHRIAQRGHWSVVGEVIVSQAPLLQDGRLIGRLVLVEDVLAVQRIKDSVIFIVLVAGLIALAVAALAGLFAARAVTHPIRAVTSAARALAAGQLDRRVPPEGPDEAVDLAHAFNAMVEEVLRQRRMERDLLAYISHELAAPLGTILGQRLGIGEDRARRPCPTPAGAGPYRRRGGQAGTPGRRSGRSGAVGERASHAHPGGGLAREQGIALSVEAPIDLPALVSDRTRLEGVLLNLIGNALAHTPTGGRITLIADGQRRRWAQWAGLARPPCRPRARCPAGSPYACGTPAVASPPRTCRASSSVSTAATGAAIVGPVGAAARGLAWRSAARRSARWAASSGPRAPGRGWAAPSRSGCRSRPLPVPTRPGRWQRRLAGHRVHR